MNQVVEDHQQRALSQESDIKPEFGHKQILEILRRNKR